MLGIPGGDRWDFGGDLGYLGEEEGWEDALEQLNPNFPIFFLPFQVREHQIPGARDGAGGCGEEVPELFPAGCGDEKDGKGLQQSAPRWGWGKGGKFGIKEVKILG